MQGHIYGGPCEHVFDFAFVFTVYSPNVTTECEQFTNDPIVIQRFSSCGKIFLSTAGQYIIYLQTGQKNSHNFYLTTSGRCGQEDSLEISLNNRLRRPGNFLKARYMLPLQFSHESIPGFNVRSLEVVFNIFVVSLTCTLDIFHEKRMTWFIPRTLFRPIMVTIYNYTYITILIVWCYVITKCMIISIITICLLSNSLDYVSFTSQNLLQ